MAKYYQTMTASYIAPEVKTVEIALQGVIASSDLLNSGQPAGWEPGNLDWML